MSFQGSLANTLCDLGTAHGKLGDIRSAKELLERALAIQEREYGPEHREVAITLTNLGNAYGSLGDAQKQKELLHRVVVVHDFASEKREPIVDFLHDALDRLADLQATERGGDLAETAQHTIARPCVLRMVGIVRHV